ncbi:hypothetical protein CHI12_07895 [Terribacillus saccharophilus]|uniref:Uncharacterized protein n=1 Tax=Terribacillus saccharophilus TaxID=361277 RepID=A0A268HDV9_9BACI|nr:hypothetical protein [Terribacillus saccharophilus]PAD34479.1 hypothetical protein CHH56_14155 [Terribacillus saccharophilus]PAD95146.1 hypothetical protein CHH50_14390 [Terribacillus saccharophilus]PAD98807.1 hypothetical protein CHH48_15280 [Terribacillus saccharophilus]PAE08058.1 hypothetical protein CHI12_07895 [Terribacillus saccharophilus]
MNQQSAKNAMLDKIVEEIFSAYPSLYERYGENGKKRTREDNQHHLDYLQSAYDADDSKLFVDYTIWLHELLSARGMNEKIIIDNYERLIPLLDNYMNKEQYLFYKACLEEGIQVLIAEKNKDEDN